MAKPMGKSPPAGGEAARRRSLETRAAGARGEEPMKYVLVSGGVVSGLGKGVTASSVGVVLKGLGFRCTAIKIGAVILPPFLGDHPARHQNVLHRLLAPRPRRPRLQAPPPRRLPPRRR